MAFFRRYPRTPASRQVRTYDASACMLRIRIAVSGAVRRMWRVATAPFMLGSREIHHHHLRLKFGGKLHGLMAVLGFADHANRRVVLQHAAEAAPHQAVVIHQEHGDAWFSHESPEALPAP